MSYRQMDFRLGKNHMGHKVPGQQGTDDQIPSRPGTNCLIAGKLFDVQANEPKEQGQKDQGQSRVVSHGGDEENEGEKGPYQQESPQIGTGEFQDRIGLIELCIGAKNEVQTKRNPEGTVPGKCTEAEIVSCLEFQQACHQLS